jgi:hypothetical protein
MLDQWFTLHPGEHAVSVKDTWNIYSTEITYNLAIIAYEIVAPVDWTFRFACDLLSWHWSTSIYAYFGLYINDVYITEVSTNLNSYTYKYIDRLIQEWDNIKFRLRTSHASYQGSMDNMVVKSWWYLPSSWYFTVI